MPQPDEILNTTEAAALVGVSPAHMRRMLAGGKVRGVKFGQRNWMIARADLEGVGRLRKPKGKKEGKYGTDLA
jgi:excisionase family DNA binding protein